MAKRREKELLRQLRSHFSIAKWAAGLEEQPALSARLMKSVLAGQSHVVRHDGLQTDGAVHASGLL